MGRGQRHMIGIAASGKDWKDGASVAGLIGYNVGILGAGAISLAHTPSWQSQKYMWLGYLAGGARRLPRVPALPVQRRRPEARLHRPGRSAASRASAWPARSPGT